MPAKPVLTVDLQDPLNPDTAQFTCTFSRLPVSAQVDYTVEWFAGSASLGKELITDDDTTVSTRMLHSFTRAHVQDGVGTFTK